MSKYKKGRRKEYKITEDLKKKGEFDIVQRTAGSHSPIDIFAINKEKKIIMFIQSKRSLSENMSYIDEKSKNKIEKELKWLKGKWKVMFKVL